MTIRLLTVLWATLALLLVVSGRPALAVPQVGCTLSLGAAQTVPLLDSGSSHGLMAALRLEALGRDLGVFAEVRNAFYRRLDDQSRVRAGIQVPVGPDVGLFVEWERFYRANDTWGFAGVRFKLF